MTRTGSELSAARRFRQVAAALSESLNVGEIVDSIVRHGAEALGAEGCGVVLLQRDGRTLNFLNTTGYAADAIAATLTFSLDAPYPASETVRSGKPIWLRYDDDWRQYPVLQALHAAGRYHAAASLPLRARGKVLGALTLSFVEPQPFDDEQQDFALAVAGQCAQALDRAQLYEDERAARALAELQQQRLEAIFEAAPARIVMSHGPEHVCLFANSRYTAHLKDRNVIGKRAGDLFPSAREQGLIAIADRVYATGEPFHATEAPFWDDRDGDGIPEEHYFNVAMVPYRDVSGRVDGVILFTIDVTDLVLARRDSETLAARLSAVLGQAAEGIVIAEPDGSISYHNERSGQILGMAEVGTPLSRHAEVYHLFDLDGRPYDSEQLPLSRAVLHGETVIGERLLVKRPDGAEVVIEATAAPVCTEDGAPAGGVATFRDVTEQVRLERHKEDFLAAVSHDLRTPLTTIKGLAQLSLRRIWAQDSEGARALAPLVGRIDATTTRMNEQIGRLLDLTRMQMSQPLVLNTAPVELVPLLREVLAEQQLAAGRHTLHLEGRDLSLIGVWDAQRLERAFSNLVGNAIKYSPDGGEIEVRVERCEVDGVPAATIAVQDPGIGIPAEERDRVFERFYRASNAMDSLPGAGIGLTGVLQIVEQHGGSIEVRSTLGEGSTFTVVLPLQPSAKEESA